MADFGFTNWFEQGNAGKLARRIVTYWKDRGQTVTVWLERVPGMKDTGEGFCVRSDMVDGLPRRG